LIVDYPSAIELAKDDPWLLARLAGEDDPANLIVVPTTLSRLSPVLAETREAFAAKRREKPGSRPHQFPKYALGLRVSLSSSDRALLLMDALVKTCVKRGLTVSIEGMRLKVGYDGSAVEVRISERVTKIVGSPYGPSKNDVLFDRDRTCQPTGELTIAVARYVSVRKTVDKQNLKLEQQLGAVLSKIYRGIAEGKAWSTHLKKMSAAWEARAKAQKVEQEARQAAAAEVRRIEEDRRRQQVDLIAEANAWQQSKTILAYADHLAAEAIKSGDPISADLQAWIEWATGAAESMDPTNKRIK
jgi:hypothetical protein